VSVHGLDNDFSEAVPSHECHSGLVYFWRPAIDTVAQEPNSSPFCPCYSVGLGDHCSMLADYSENVGFGEWLNKKNRHSSLRTKLFLVPLDSAVSPHALYFPRN
jgi:hypothetical protein